MGALEEVRDLAEAVARRRSLRLWDVEMGGRPGRAIVRVFVDADDGLDLDTVAEVSEEISRGLDLRDPIQGRYTLEVSSPGLERSLKEPEHWRVSVGKKVVVKTKEKLVGDSHRLDAVVDSATADAVVLRRDGDDGTVEVPFEAIRSARTVFEWGAGDEAPKKHRREAEA
jgi:ribosome maturation factor RimP